MIHSSTFIEYTRRFCCFSLVSTLIRVYSLFPPSRAHTQPNSTHLFLPMKSSSSCFHRTDDVCRLRTVLGNYAHAYYGLILCVPHRVNQKQKRQQQQTYFPRGFCVNDVSSREYLEFCWQFSRESSARLSRFGSLDVHIIGDYLAGRCDVFSFGSDMRYRWIANAFVLCIHFVILLRWNLFNLWQ